MDGVRLVFGKLPGIQPDFGAGGGHEEDALLADEFGGIDIANDMGTPIVATADGVVEVAGWNSGGYGNMVDIDHGNGIWTRYGHAEAVAVSVGETVQKGQIIAYMGSTGFSTGPHVHYEVRINGQPVNPSAYLH